MEKEEAMKLLLTEGKNTYKEFASIKLILFSFIGILTVIAGIALSFLLLPILIAIVVTLVCIGIGACIIWKGLRWQYPRYMVLNHLFCKKRRYSKKKFNSVRAKKENIFRPPRLNSINLFMISLLVGIFLILFGTLIAIMYSGCGIGMIFIFISIPLIAGPILFFN